MMQEENHIFLGLRRDNHLIRQKAEFLWDAHNIRLTNRDDSTLFSITNERGPKEYTEEVLEGCYVGHCTVGKYLVVFTASNENDNDGNCIRCSIYRIEQDKDRFNIVTLFQEDSWDKAWTPYNPIEALGVYETELVLKVYWIDGINQPRVINIALPELNGNPYTKEDFDFVLTLMLEEEVSISKLFGEGMFAPGVIQYAFTYYKKYGLESNIFYTSPLHYVSFKDRGGSPEEKVACSFLLDITGIDKNFDYIRVYSIHRTSINAEPTVKRVTDIYVGNNPESVSYIDDGTVGDIVDNMYLLYVGGEEIVPNAIASKDNTLFLANYSISRQSVPKEIKQAFNDDGKDNLYFNTRSINSYSISNGDYYKYVNELNNTNISYFKSGEHYRLGILFQHKSGKWSEPIIIKKDYTVPSSYTIINDELKEQSVLVKPLLEGVTLQLPYFSLKKEANDFIWREDGEESIVATLKKLGYKKVRTVSCYPTNIDSKIVALGILCPTVFNYHQRATSGIYSLPSWIFRPNYYGLNFPSLEEISTIGAWAECRHLHVLGGNLHLNAEIQSNDAGNYSASSTINSNLGNDEFLVDQSILTFHSPDIEFNSNFANILLDNCKLRIVGVVPFNSNIGDIDIKTNTTTFGNLGTGFLHEQYKSPEEGGRSLLTGPFYYDALVTPKSSSDDSVNKSNLLYKKFAVYPWHRHGSLNSDYSRIENDGVRSAELGVKKISNLRFSNSNIWLSSSYNIDQGITTPQLWRNGEGELLKIEGKSYLGDIDFLITKDNLDGYDIMYLEGDAFTFSQSAKKSKDPIRMKYKSSPHLVFKLNSNSSNEETILPVIKGTLPPVSLDYNRYTEDFNPELRYLYFGKYKDGLFIGRHSNPVGLYGLHITNTFPESNSMWGVFYRCTSYTERIIQAVKDNSYFGRGIVYNVTVPTLGTRYLKARGAFSDNTILFDDITDSYSIDNPNTADSKITVKLQEIDLSEYTDNKILSINKGYLYLAELYRDTPLVNSFGGTSDSDIENNTLWFPASDPLPIDHLDEDADYWSVPFIYGDTFYQRYDCLKTYPYTKEDENLIIEIGSFMCETKVNIDGRYDRNRGNDSNLNVSPENFNRINEVYSLKNNFFNYRILNEDYYKNDKYAHQVIWSTEKFAGMDIDPWTNVSLATPLDMDGTKGPVTKLATFNDTLLCLQEKAFSRLLFNVRTQIPVTDGVPIEIDNGRKMDGYNIISEVGCLNKWSVCNSINGLYFIDDNTDTLWMYSDKLSNISDTLGMRWWFKKNHSSNSWVPLGINSLRTFYDATYGDMYFVPNDGRDALCFSEQLLQFISLYSYGGTPAMVSLNNTFLSLRHDDEAVSIWENFKGDYNMFFNGPKGWDISFISNDNPTYTKIFDTIELRTDHYEQNDEYPLNTCPVNYIQVSNEYQDTGIVDDKLDMKKKFRVWRGLIPRNKNTRQRIRNLWANITIGWKPETDSRNNRKAVIHDTTVKYTV